MRVRNQYVLDIDDAVAAIRNFNESPIRQAAEWLIAESFGTIRSSLHGSTIASRVVLIDGLWATQLFWAFGSSDRIAESLALHSGELISMFEALGADDLRCRPELVIAAARAALPIVLHIENSDGDRLRQNYSFATKFFHWCTRHHFPIVDSRARAQVNRIQTEARVRPRVLKDTTETGGLTYIEEYDRWIHFYSDLISGLATDDVERLLRADFDSQLSQYCVRNSILRVLDKVFYQKASKQENRTPTVHVPVDV